MPINRIKHHYFNKYLVSPLSAKKYFLSYNFKYKVLWFRVYKVATRTIECHLREGCEKNEYLYSSAVGYLPVCYKNWFKFAFVRNPVDRFISAYKDKVLNQNYFLFRKDEHSRMKELSHFLDYVEQLDIENCDEHLRAQCALIDTRHLDFLGYFENFSEDFDYLARSIGMQYEKLKTMNKSGKSNFELSDNERSRIEQIYHKDLELFYRNV